MEQQPEILIIYNTQNGRTGAMVAPVREGIESQGVAARVRKVEEVEWEEMLAADGIVVGTPVHFGDVDWQIKRLFDVTAYEGYPGPLVGKVGGAFTGGSKPGSGAELALVSMLHILLNHGLVIQGNSFGAHYGPIALADTKPETVVATCQDWGRHWARLVLRLRAGAATGPSIAAPATAP